MHRRQDPPVRRTKVVTPRADAVRLVHRDERDAQRLQRPREHTVPVELLRRSVQQVQLAARELFHHLCALGRRLHGVDGGRADERGTGGRDLVEHERHERRYDEGGAAQGSGCRLKADRLPRARRLHCEHVRPPAWTRCATALQWVGRERAEVLQHCPLERFKGRNPDPLAQVLLAHRRHRHCGTFLCLELLEVRGKSRAGSGRVAKAADGPSARSNQCG
mmetsp:Transcript_29897/g.95450  ORF Transcript_29897/g.95450 Transcript_29897/m.95450 type:complete len:220 (-) Transcript_29897:63-722(-)